MSKRTLKLPSAPEAERGIVGIALTDESLAKVASDSLSPDDFSDMRCGLIMAGIRSVEKKGGAPDVKTVSDEMLAAKTLEDAGGLDFFMDLVSEVITSDPDRLDFYLSKVKEASKARRFILACGKISCDFESRYKGSWGDFVDEAKANLDLLALDGDLASVKSAGEVAKETVDDVERLRKANGSSGLIGIKTGLGKLDSMTHGWAPGQLIVIAGKTSMGKSAFAAHSAWTAALSGAEVAYFSLEMRNTANMKRIISNVTGIDSERINGGFTNDKDIAAISSAADSIGRTKMYFCDCLSFFEDISANIARLKARHPGLGLVVIDYLQLMATRMKGLSRDREIGSMTGALKRLANSLGIAIMVLSQVNRSTESDRPTMDNLRESGNIEQDANVIVFIHRPDYFDKTKPQGRFSVAEIIVAKNREGKTGLLCATYDKATSRFADFAKGTEALGGTDNGK